MSEGGKGCRLIVIGASAGGVEALQRVVSRLPAELPAAVAVVLHISRSGTSVLPEILRRQHTLPVERPQEGEEVLPGRIYVAPPDRHLLVADGRFILSAGPRENGHRPAIDPLFHSAAEAWGPAVIGVVLTGALDDGAAGLAAVKVAGGIAVVQDPEDAMHRGMPTSALERTSVDHVVALDDLPPLLVELVGDGEATVSDPIEPPSPADPGRDLDAGPGMSGGDAAGLSCPECGGSLWFVEQSGAPRFRCRIGHAYSEQSLFEQQGEALEAALWAALRALEERAALLRRTARRAETSGHQRSAATFLAKAAEIDDRAAIIRTSIVPTAIDPEASVG
jgi:two-component system, chemotaxis family, protein-glutamate methylesterase/glutaminase